MTEFNKNKAGNSSDQNDRKVLLDPYIDLELEDRYRVDELIGSGGWGNVYRGTDITDGSIIAIKIVHRHHLNDESSIKRFELEAKSMSRVQSPYIVKIIDCASSPSPFIVMEYFEGISLSQWLKINGPMKPPLAIELFLQLCDGLAVAESKHIVHRDLKPSNILLKFDGNDKIQCKILDFGLAKFIESSVAGGVSLTATGEVLGSPPYMSPEQWKGQCDNRSDIYSLGCIMYEVLAGRPPFSAQFGIEYMSMHLSDRPARISTVNLNQPFPAALEDVVSKCMQKAPASRYQSSTACAADLSKIKVGHKPAIFILEDIVSRNKKLITLSATFLLAVTGSLYLIREPLIHSVCSSLYKRAASSAQPESAATAYRQILLVSLLLPQKDLQKLRALRILEAYYGERRDLASAKSFQTQIDKLIGSTSSDAEMTSLANKVQSGIDSGDLAEASRLGKDALELARSKLGKQSMAYADCLNSLGTIAYRKGNFEESAEFYKKSLAISDELLEPNDFRKTDLMDHLAAALSSAGKTEESDKYFKQAQALKESKTYQAQ